MLISMMKKGFYIITFFSVLFLMGCDNNPFKSSHDESVKTPEKVFSPFNIETLDRVEYKGEDYRNLGYKIATSDKYMALSARDENHRYAVFLYEKMPSSLKLVSAITPDMGYMRVFSLTLSDDYLVIGNYTSNDSYKSRGNLLLYKIEDNKTLTKLSTITPQDSEDNWDYFGKKVIIDNDKILVSTSENSVYLFQIEKNATVKQIAKIAMPQKDATDSYQFATDIAMDGDKIAIGAFSRERNEIIYLYNIETNDTISLTDSVDFMYRGYFNKNISLKNHYLATSENYNNLLHVYKITNNHLQEIAQKTLNLSDLYYYNYLSMDQDYIYATSNFNDKVGLSIFKINGNTIADGVNVAFDIKLPAQFHAIKISNNDVFIAQRIGRFSEKVFLYNFDAIKQVYLYKTPPKEFDIGEGNPFFYSFDAASPVGDVSYVLEGDDPSFFTMDENNVTNAVTFNYEHPLDNNGDNNYTFKVNIQDPDANKKIVNISVIVHDKKYLKSDLLTMDAGPSSIASYGDYIAIGLGSLKRVEIYKNIDGVLTKITEITEDIKKTRTWFGSSVAMYGNTLIVGSPRSNSSHGTVYIYKINNERITLFQKIEPTETMYFGTSVAITKDKFCVGTNRAVNRDHYTDGELYLYHYSDTNVTQLSHYTHKTNDYTFYSNVPKLMMNDKYIVAHSVHGIYIDKIDINGSIDGIAKVNSDQYYLKDIALQDNKVIVVTDTNMTLYSIDVNDSLSARSTYTFKIKSYVDQDSVDMKNDTISLSRRGKAEIFHIENNNTITYVDTLNKYDTWHCDTTHLLEDGNITASSYYSNRFFLYLKDKD
jgi:hypothetical protein